MIAFHSDVEASTVEVDYPKKSSVGSNSQVSHRRSFDCHKCSCTCHGKSINGLLVFNLGPFKYVCTHQNTKCKPSIIDHYVLSSNTNEKKQHTDLYPRDA